MEHWAEKYIGKPWARSTRGPDTYDCWGLVQAIYSNEFGIELPEPNCDASKFQSYSKAIETGRDHEEWCEQVTPFEGCVVPMSQSRIFHHVGIWLDIDGGVILHSYNGACVVAQTLTTLQSNNWRRFKYYKHVDFKNDLSS